MSQDQFAATALPFGECAEDLIGSMRSRWRNRATEQNWRYTLATHAASIWEMPVDEVDAPAVLRCLSPIWETHAPTASCLRGRIEAVLDYAKVGGRRAGENPASWKGHLKYVLPAVYKPASREHLEALPYPEVPAFVASLARCEDRIAAQALEFLILTGARSAEVYGARWEEIDLSSKVWTIPGARMKAGREHRVPFVARAIEILEAMRGFTGGTIATSRGDKEITGEFIFPARQHRCPHLPEDAMSRVMRALHPSAKVHGFRSSFRDWAISRAKLPSKPSPTRPGTLPRPLTGAEMRWRSAAS